MLRLVGDNTELAGAETEYRKLMELREPLARIIGTFGVVNLHYLRGRYGDVLNEWNSVRIDGICPLLISMETHKTEISLNHPRVNGGYTNIRAMKIELQSRCQSRHGKLRSAVHRSTRINIVSRNRSDIDDMAAVSLYHTRHHGFGHENKSLDVRVDHRVEIVDLKLMQRPIS